MDRMQKILSDIPQERIDEILQQAWDAAAAEAREIIKGWMLEAILNQAAANHTVPIASQPGIPAGGRVLAQEPPISVEPVIGAVPLGSTADKPAAEPEPGPALAGVLSEQAQPDAVLAEIEEIRRKIYENEQALQSIKTPPAPMPSKPAQVISPVASEPQGQGFYLYAVTRKGVDPCGSCPGIDPAKRIYTLPYENIQAIVSKVDLSEFGEEELKANLNDPVWLEDKVRAHQTLLEFYSATGALVPMRFCTIYFNEARIEALLEEYFSSFSAALADLSGKQEMGLKIFCDAQRLAQRVSETSPTILARKTDVANKSSGLAYFAKKKLEEQIGEEAERWNLASTQDSHNRLGACSEKSVILPMQAKEATGRAEEMALNSAYLVADERMADFRKELETLETEYGPVGFEYVLTGPWPPYNFVSIGAEKVETA